MKKVLTLIAVLCMAVMVFTGCFESTPACEHNWTEATCTAPQTCSLCGETDGEALGHTEETITGTAATCTTAGLTDGKKCSVCGEITVQQTTIAAKDHTEETVAGTPATCTEPGLTDGKKCSVCGVTTVEQTSIDPLNHKAGEDDGDVTTPVKCANEGCDHIFVEAKEAITLTIPTLENGTVVADKKNYAIGDTVKLTVNPAFGYVQKLYIDGEPLILGWNNNVYSFVAEKDAYVLTGSFEQSLNLKPFDVTRWELGNQAHGVISTQYNAGDHNKESWWFDFNGDYSSISVKVKNYLPLEESKDGNGNTGFSFVLRITLDNGKSHAFRVYNDKGEYAIQEFDGSWGYWTRLDAEAATALNADGVDFKLEREGSVLKLSVNGKVYITYTMAGVTADNKVTAVGLRHYGNIDKQIDIPFELTSACDHDWEDETCTAPRTCSECGVTVGEKLKHTDGEPAEENYNAPGCVTQGSYDKVVYCTVCSTQVSRETVPVPATDHKDEDKNYKCDVCNADLCTNHTPGDPEVQNRVEPDFGVEGSYDEVTYCTKCGTETSRVTKSIPAKVAITLTIPTLENGTVTADKVNYAIGDTVTLTVVPAEKYAQKLYINGEPILVDTNSKYSFTVTQDAYEITGEFVSTSGKWFWIPETFDVINQGHNVVLAKAGTTGELVPTQDKCYGGKVLVKDPSQGTQKEYAIAFKMHFADGQKAEVRLIDESGNGKYRLQVLGNNILGNWGGIYTLTDAENAAIATGDGVWFSMVREGTTLKLLINDNVVKTYDLSEKGITADTKVSQFKLQAYNLTVNTNISYEFYMTE